GPGSKGQAVSDHDEVTVERVVDAVVDPLLAPSADPSGDAQRMLAAQLVDQAQAEGISLVGPGGLLADLTKLVLETGLEVEMDEHLGYAKHDPVGRDGGNSRNGTRSKTVITEIGPVTVDVPRDRDGTFTPVPVRKR